MGLNISKGNMYDFVTHTWNTVKGACPHRCSYCYMKRWGKQREPYFDNKELKTDLGEGNFIFVGSSCDLFAEMVPGDWIEKTIQKMNEHDNKYFLQSKNPERIAHYRHKLYKKALVICTTIETNRMQPEYMGLTPSPHERADIMNAFSQPKMVTIEPIMEFDTFEMVELIKRCEPLQVNIGADSGRNKLPEPTFDKVMDLISRLGEFTRVIQKKNLSRLME